MALTRPIVTATHYSASRTSDGIELRVVHETISFVEETIPDGQMAGMKGHREVPATHEITFELHPTEARMLWEQLGEALDTPNPS